MKVNLVKSQEMRTDADVWCLLSFCRLLLISDDFISQIERRKKVKKEFIEIWGDLVTIKDLILAILLCSGFTMTGYFIAPAADQTKQLFFGLGGAVLGFLITTFVLKPKRTVIEEEE